MTDPVAEAAANLAKQHAEPTLIEEIKEGMHELAEKVEHLIHPETSVNAVSELIGQHDDSDVHHAVEGVEAPNASPASMSGTPTDSTPSPVVQDAPAPDVPAINSPTVELGNVAAVETASSLAESSTLSALTLPETSTASSESAEDASALAAADAARAEGFASDHEVAALLASAVTDLPNAAPAAVAEPDIAASALDASGSDNGQAVEPSVHESLLRKIIVVIERDFNMFSGELSQLMAEAKTHL